jgi:hypothetical protein
MTWRIQALFEQAMETDKGKYLRNIERKSKLEKMKLFLKITLKNKNSALVTLWSSNISKFVTVGYFIVKALKRQHQTLMVQSFFNPRPSVKALSFKATTFTFR